MNFSRYKCFWAVLLSASQLVMGGETVSTRLVPGAVLAQPIVHQPGELAEQDSVQSAAGFQIMVIDGQDAVNIVKSNSAGKVTVEVRDKNNVPVAGALVTFTAPDDGASLIFANGSRTATAVTEVNGRAVAPSAKPVNTGKFQLSVSVSQQSQTGAVNIVMTNVMTAAGANPTADTATPSAHGLSTKTIGIIVGVGAGAAIGIALALMHHSSSTTTTNPVTVSSGGNPTVGAP